MGKAPRRPLPPNAKARNSGKEGARRPIAAEMRAFIDPDISGHAPLCHPDRARSATRDLLFISMRFLAIARNDVGRIVRYIPFFVIARRVFLYSKRRRRVSIWPTSLRDFGPITRRGNLHNRHGIASRAMTGMVFVVLPAPRRNFYVIVFIFFCNY